MMKLLVIAAEFALFGLQVLAFDNSVPSSYILQSKRSAVPHGWVRLHRAESSSLLPHPLRFGLVQPNLDRIDEFLYAVSDPESSTYGRHWDAEKVEQMFEPTEETFRVVKGWIEAMGFGAKSREDNDGGQVSFRQGWIEVNATVGEAERLLLAEYHVYEHEKTGRKHVVANTYHLPSHVAPHVEVVVPTVDFNIPTKHAKRLSSNNSTLGTGPFLDRVISTIYDDLEHCDSQTTPKCLRALYQFETNGSSARLEKENTFGVVEYTPQAYLQSDLDMFFQKFSPEQNGSSPVLVSVDGGIAQADIQSFDFNGESDLDLEYAMILTAKDQLVTLYQVGDTIEGGSFNNFLDALDFSYCSYGGGDDYSEDAHYPDHGNRGGYDGPTCGTAKPTHVISTSYGYNEADLSPAYAARQCYEYAKLGLMGVTVIFSSGDNGVAGNGGLCLNPDGSQSLEGQKFNPGFPSTCPYITSIGATQVIPGANITVRSKGQELEMACGNVIFSGGGFSNYFGLPAYQERVVKEYLNRYPSPPVYMNGTFNSSGNSRAFPDLSANGAYYVVAMDSIFDLVFGTSASAPVVAAVITTINDARLSAGKSPVGFINPTIYSPHFRSAFHEITQGNNPGCGTSGFEAVSGWNPVVGLGTPNFQELLYKFMQLP